MEVEVDCFITDSWCVDDVQAHFSAEREVSEADAMSILSIMEKKYDANVGYNYGTLEYSFKLFYDAKGMDGDD